MPCSRLAERVRLALMRVDDDNSERIEQEVRAQDRKTQEQEGKRREGETTAFDRALRSKQQAPAVAQARRLSGFPSKLSRQRKIADDTETNPERGIREEEPGKGDAPGRKGSLATGQRQRAETLAQDDLRRDGDERAVRDSDGREGEGRLGSRKEQQRKQDATREENVGRGRSAREGRAAGPNADGGSGNQQGSQQGGQHNRLQRLGPQRGPGCAPAGSGAAWFPRRRCPTAPRSGDSQKIVQSARVGVNRMGLPEMQIELKSEVLHGLKVKVSGRHGRVRAQFISSDRQVLEQLRSGMVDFRETLSRARFEGRCARD